MRKAIANLPTSSRTVTVGNIVSKLPVAISSVLAISSLSVLVV